MSKHEEMVFAAAENTKATSALTTSWRRCINLHKLQPGTLRPPEPDSTALHDGLQREAALVATAGPNLDQLFKGIGRPDATVWLADRHGLVLDQRTGLSQDIWKRKPTHWVGARYDERACGTSGVATCLAEELPGVVAGAGHFFARYVPLTGIGAPIFGPNGHAIGCLSCSYHARDDNCDQLVLSIVSTFARRIGIEMFAAAFPRTQLLLAARDACSTLTMNSSRRGSRAATFSISPTAWPSPRPASSLRRWRATATIARLWRKRSASAARHSTASSPRALERWESGKGGEARLSFRRAFRARRQR